MQKGLWKITITMKKYSSEYFEKKFRILFQKLLVKEDFLDAIKETRKKLGLPDGGFGNELELASHLIGKMSKNEQTLLALFAFAKDYSSKNNLALDEENKENILQAVWKEYGGERDGGVAMAPMMFELAGNILDHHQMLTQNLLFRKNKFLSKLFPETMKLIKKFWGLDLLDEHIMAHFVERYLFLGEYGVNQYINIKLACTNCRYIGVDHFSPMQTNMEGKNMGPYGKGYIFNKETVKRLSLNFNSVFLIIKPYATKEAVLQYVEDNWGWLKEHIIEKNPFYAQFGVHPSKIKESDFERNRLIYELYKPPKKDVIKMYRGERDFSTSGVYKEMVVSAILKEEHGIEMTPDAVKKTATRFAQDARIKNKPRDIRDI